MNNKIKAGELPKPKYEGFINLDNIKIPEGVEMEVLKEYEIYVKVVLINVNTNERWAGEKEPVRKTYEFGIKSADMIGPIEEPKKDNKKKWFKLHELVK